MRIALVNDYSLQRIGGAVASMLEQKKALEMAGHTVIVLQLGKRSEHRAYDDRGFTYIKPTLTLPASLYNMPILFAGRKHDRLITKILTDNKIEAIHTQSEMSLAHICARASKTLGIPMFFTVHTIFWTTNDQIISPLVTNLARKLFERSFRQKVGDYKPTGNDFEKLLKNITLSLASQCTAVFSPSAHQKDILQATTLKTPIHVVPNPFSGSTKPARVIEKAPSISRFVWAGRMVKEKRFVEFLDAIMRVESKTDKPFNVDIVGDGMLGFAKKDYPLKEITYHGHKSHDETVALIDAADILVITSYHFDNQPMIIAEAISRFRPVLYCDERLKEGTNIAGYLTKDETPEAIANAMLDLIENPEKLVALSKKATKAAEIFAPETFVKTVVKLYQS